MPYKVSTHAIVFLFTAAFNGLSNGMINVVPQLYLISLAGAVEPEGNNSFNPLIKSKEVVAKHYLLEVISLVSGNFFFNLFAY